MGRQKGLSEFQQTGFCQKARIHQFALFEKGSQSPQGPGQVNVFHLNSKTCLMDVSAIRRRWTPSYVWDRFQVRHVESWRGRNMDVGGRVVFEDRLVSWVFANKSMNKHLRGRAPRLGGRGFLQRRLISPGGDMREGAAYGLV
jgi:hypothetical protein